MTTTLSIIGLFLALFLLIYLAFKGHSVIIIAPVVAIVAIIFSSGLDSHLMAEYTEVYMKGFANYVKKLLPSVSLRSCFCKDYGSVRVC